MIVVQLGDTGASWVDIVGSLGTLAAVVVALVVAFRSERVRRRERLDDAHSRARLVQFHGPQAETDPSGDTRSLVARGHNYSPGAIFLFHCEIWDWETPPPGQGVSSRKGPMPLRPDYGWAEGDECTHMTFPGQPIETPWRHSLLDTEAWRASWKDEQGYVWAIDGGDPNEPYPFNPNKPPRMTAPGDGYGLHPPRMGAYGPPHMWARVRAAASGALAAWRDGVDMDKQRRP